MTRQDKTRLDSTGQDKARQGKARQGKARQGKARQDKTRLLTSYSSPMEYMDPVGLVEVELGLCWVVLGWEVWFANEMR